VKKAKSGDERNDAKMWGTLKRIIMGCKRKKKTGEKKRGLWTVE